MQKNKILKKKNNEHKIRPLVLPPLNQINNNKNINNINQNWPLLLSSIKQFKFKIIKKKKIKYINFNQNKIIENVNKSNDEKQKPLIRLFNKNPQSHDFRRNINEINDINKIDNKEKDEIFRKMINNETLKSTRIQLGKSQSTGLFPKIKIT